MNELGNLSHCMVDSDFVAHATTKSAKRNALIASSALEFVLIALAVLWPLARPEILSPRTIVTPLPPFHGVPQTPPVERVNAASSDQRPLVPIIVMVLHPPQRAAIEPSEAAPPTVYDPLALGSSGPSLVIPGETGNGSVILAPPRPAATGAGPVHVSSGVMQAALIHRVEPVYPSIAKAIHLEGTVNLRAIITTDGSIAELTVLSGNPMLAQAAEAAVRQWRYKPTLLNNQQTEVETIITVNFRLD